MTTRTFSLSLLLVALLAGFPASSLAAAPTKGDAVELLNRVDEAQRRGSDWKQTVVIATKQGEGPTSAREALIYNQDDGFKMVLMITKPRTEAGQGYLLLDRNVWYYDPAAGRWERRTERDRIAGTATRRSDFDAPHYNDKYNATWEGNEAVGKTNTVKILLDAKPGIDVAYRKVRVWIDPTTALVLKEEDYAVSGKLARRNLLLNWQKQFNPAKKSDVWFAGEIRVLSVEDDVESVAVTKAIDIQPHETNVFTKAWFESKSH